VTETEGRTLTALQLVVATVAAAVLLGIGLIIAGVAVLAGLAWALITAGVLISLGAIGTGVALLREPAKEQP
jgi:hypothetical protein